MVSEQKTEDLSPEQIVDIKAEIHEMFPDVNWPDHSLENMIVVGFDYPIPGYKIVMENAEDEENCRFYKPVSDQYNFIPFEVVTKKFLNFLERNDRWGTPSFNVQILDNAGKMKFEAQFDELKEITAKARQAGDKIAPILGFRHSVDLGWAYSTLCGALRLICSNGLVAFRMNIEQKKKHRSTLDIDSMNEALASTFKEYDEQIGVWNYWSELELNGEQAEEVLEASGFGARHKEEILALPETATGETIQDWIKRDNVIVMDMYNVMTQFITHEIDSDMVRDRRGEEVAAFFHNEFKQAA